MYVNNELIKEWEGILRIRNFLNHELESNKFEINYTTAGVNIIRYHNIGNDTIKKGKITIRCTEKQLDKITDIIKCIIKKIYN